jgi:predicted small lipoprotein YifL
MTAVAIVAALGLSGCGRKGALDAPPGAAIAPADASAASTEPQPERSLLGDPSGRSSAPVAPKGVKKRIPLDVLLD